MESSELSCSMQFSNFDELKKFIEKYEQQNSVQLYVSNSTKLSSVQYKNAKSADPGLVYYAIQYRCVHGGNFESSSKGMRKSSTLRQGCSFTLKFGLSYDGKFLKLKKNETEHSHGIDSAIFNSMPRQRRLNEEEESQVKTFLDMRCNKRLVKDYIKTKMNKVVLLKDLSNIKTKHQKVSSDDLKGLVKFLKDQDQASVEIIVDGEQFEGIYFQTNRMKNAFEKHPEVVLLDATYCLNNLNFPLYIIMVINGNGQGEVACTFLLAHETEANIKKMLTIFKENNGSFEKIETVFTDKDFKERKALKEELPKSNLCLCMFHTLRTFNRHISCDKMGISSETRQRALYLLQKMTYATSQEEYNKQYMKLVNMDQPKIIEYFNKNWDSIKEEWVVGFMKTKFTLTLTTTNHLECLNQKIKEVVVRNSPIEIFFKDLVCLLNSIHDEAMLKSVQMCTRKSTNYAKGSVEEKYNTLLTPFAFSLIEKEILCTSSVDIDELINFSTTTNYCQCELHVNTGMPCRHIFNLLENNGESIFQPTLVKNKFKKMDHFAHLVTRDVAHIVDEADDSPKIHQTSVNANKSVLDKKSKYKKAMMLCGDIANMIADYGTKEFELIMETLKLMKDAVRQRKKISLHVGDEGEITNDMENGTQPEEIEQIIGEMIVEEEVMEDTIVEVDVVRKKEKIKLHSGDEGEITNNTEDRTEIEEMEQFIGEMIVEEEEVMEGTVVEVEEVVRVNEELVEEEIDNHIIRGNLSSGLDHEYNKRLKLENIQLKTLKVKRLGRPKGSDHTVIGLKKRK